MRARLLVVRGHMQHVEVIVAGEQSIDAVSLLKWRFREQEHGFRRLRVGKPTGIA